MIWLERHNYYDAFWKVDYNKCGWFTVFGIYFRFIQKKYFLDKGYIC